MLSSRCAPQPRCRPHGSSVRCFVDHHRRRRDPADPGPATPPYVLVLTNYDTDADILGAVEAGASGYLLKDAPPHELLAAVRAAAAGESALAPVIASRLLDRMRSPRISLSSRRSKSSNSSPPAGRTPKSPAPLRHRNHNQVPPRAHLLQARRHLQDRRRLRRPPARHPPLRQEANRREQSSRAADTWGRGGEWFIRTVPRPRVVAGWAGR